MATFEDISFFFVPPRNGVANIHPWSFTIPPPPSDATKSSKVLKEGKQGRCIYEKLYSSEQVMPLLFFFCYAM